MPDAGQVPARPLNLAADNPKPGSTVYAIGNPQGFDKTIRQGLFTGYRDLEGRRVAEISAAISPGSSGGPIVNVAGDVVGVAEGSFADGQNFAVPRDIVREFIAGGQPSSDVQQGVVRGTRWRGCCRFQHLLWGPQGAQVMRYVIAVCLLVGVAGCARSPVAPSTDVSGVWVGLSSTALGAETFTVTITQNGPTLAGFWVVTFAASASSVATGRLSGTAAVQAWRSRSPRMSNPTATTSSRRRSRPPRRWTANFRPPIAAPRRSNHSSW